MHNMSAAMPRFARSAYERAWTSRHGARSGVKAAEKARGGRGGAHLDGRDVVPLHHVAPKCSARARVLLEALGDERIEPHHRIEAIDHASEPPAPDGGAIAHEEHPAERGARGRCRSGRRAGTANNSAGASGRGHGRSTHIGWSGDGDVVGCKRKRRLLVSRRRRPQSCGCAPPQPHKLHDAQEHDGNPKSAKRGHTIQEERNEQHEDEPS